MRRPDFLLALFSFLVFTNFCYGQGAILNSKDTIEKPLRKNERHVYALALEKGGYAELVIRQKGVDVAIDLIDPAGRKIKTFDSPNGPNGPEAVSFPATLAGRYKIQIYALDEGTHTGSEGGGKGGTSLGKYRIEGVTVLLAKAYQQRLSKEREVMEWVRQNANAIVKQDLNIAAKIADLHFTDQEVDSMYDHVQEINERIKQMHTLSLANSVPMSLWQSPVLPGVKFPEAQVPIDWNIPSNVQLPQKKNDLAFYSVLQLASLIKNRKISSVELTHFFLDRLKKFGDTLECVIALTEDIALQQAKQADAEIASGKYKGPLHGIPYGLKDLFAVKGTRTTWGAAPYRNQIIDEDSYVYSKLREAGGVLVAKLTLGALAMDDQWFGGRTNNPWNLKTGSSGSSAGSAAATVAGLLPFAIGTETLGSIISPSATCGATGLRSTFGSISRSGAMTLSWSMDKIGPICRSAEDAAVVFQSIHGTDGKDMSAVDHPFNYQGSIDIKSLKIGYERKYFSALDSNSIERKVLDVFRGLGATLVPIDFPDSNISKLNAGSIANTVIEAESAAAFDEFTRYNIDDQMTSQKKSDWPNTFRSARFIPAVEYINANRHRYLMMQAMDKIMSQFDVIICGSFGEQLYVTNLTGHPAICFPSGFNQEHLPTSITLIGKLFDEATLLQLGKLYQDQTEWNKRHPLLFQ